MRDEKEREVIFSPANTNTRLCITSRYHYHYHYYLGL